MFINFMRIFLQKYVERLSGYCLATVIRHSSECHKPVAATLFMIILWAEEFETHLPFTFQLNLVHVFTFKIERASAYNTISHSTR